MKTEHDPLNLFPVAKRSLITTGYYLPYDPNLLEHARELRRQMTPSEKKLWYGFLRGFQFRFIRQHPIDHYIVDFYCPKLKLIIEIDGDSHFSVSGKEYDEKRTQILEGYGLRELRFTNTEVMQSLEEVCKKVIEIADQVKNPPKGLGGF